MKNPSYSEGLGRGNENAKGKWGKGPCELMIWDSTVKLVNMQSYRRIYCIYRRLYCVTITHLLNTEHVPDTDRGTGGQMAVPPDPCTLGDLTNR